MDPEKDVSWDAKLADGGCDIKFQNVLLDVKTTITPYQSVIWSKDINHLLLTSRLDLIVSVSNDPQNGEDCWIEGYISKEEFFKKKSIAGEKTGGKFELEEGTWSVLKSEMWPIVDFESPSLVAMRCGKQFEYISGVWFQ
jgi:hypothetical protein